MMLKRRDYLGVLVKDLILSHPSGMIIMEEGMPF
jgi:hypothetical protein